MDGVECTKYLGVYIDNALDWKKHIQAVSKKISHFLGMIKYAKRVLPSESLGNLYTSFADPHFRYCCEVWGVYGIAEIQQLQKLQNRTARIITGSNYDTPSRPLISHLDWKTIKDLIKHEFKIVVFKSRMGLLSNTSSIYLLLTHMIPRIIYEILLLI